MRYQIPEETLPGARPDLAAAPLAVVLSSLVAGAAPALAWMALNARFLGCRDARRQAWVAGLGFLAIKAFSVLALVLRESAAAEAALGAWRTLAADFSRNLSLMALLGVLVWMSGRQETLAAHYGEIGRPISLGLGVIAGLTALNVLIVPLIDLAVPYFGLVWGRMAGPALTGAVYGWFL